MEKIENKELAGKVEEYTQKTKQISLDARNGCIYIPMQELSNRERF